MKWHFRVILAAACSPRRAVISASEVAESLSETTLTESQCTATVKKVQASGKFTEDAILPICSSEVKSSKCDFFAEALSLASTHSDFTSKVFCKDMAEAHACSQMMDSLYQSTATKDLLYGECMRAPEAKSNGYCNKFKSLLSRSVRESDLDTMRACYMMQAFDEKDGEIERSAKTEPKKESKDEKAIHQPTRKPSPKEASTPSTQVNTTVKEPKQPAQVASAKATSQHVNKTVKAHQPTKHDVAKYHALASKSKPASTVKSTTNSTKSAAKKDEHALLKANETSVSKINATNPKGKVVGLTKQNNTKVAKTNATNQSKAKVKKADDEKKYHGFLSGFVL